MHEVSTFETTEAYCGRRYLRISDISHSYKELEWIKLSLITNASFDISLDLALSLLSVAGEGKLLLVAPQDIRATRGRFACGTRQASLR